jgi:hypothetical protein
MGEGSPYGRQIHIAGLEERYNKRDLTYSRWHRPSSIERFLEPEAAAALSMIDIDAVEFCRECSQPLMLIETVRDVGQSFKATTVIAEIACRGRIPAALVFYTLDEHQDCYRFRVRGVWPKRTPEVKMWPEQYAAWLHSLRDSHAHTCPGACSFRRRHVARRQRPNSRAPTQLLLVPGQNAPHTSAQISPQKGR